MEAKQEFHRPLSRQNEKSIAVSSIPQPDNHKLDQESLPKIAAQAQGQEKKKPIVWSSVIIGGAMSGTFSYVTGALLLKYGLAVDRTLICFSLVPTLFGLVIMRLGLKGEKSEVPADFFKFGR